MRKRLFEPAFPFDPARLPFFYGWVIVAVATLGTIFSIPGQTMGFAAFTEILMQDYGLSRVLLSTAYFAGTVASGFALPFAGRLFDHWGARRMMVLSSVATGLVLLYLSQAPNWTVWLTASLSPNLQTWVAFAMIGIGFFMIRLAAQGVLSMTCRNAVGKWFNINRGMAMALSGIFVAFGFSAAPKFLNYLITAQGQERTWITLALLTLFVMAPLGWLLLRDNPEECGLTMDGPSKKPRGKGHPDLVVHREFTRSEAVRTFSFHVFNLSFAFFSLYSTAFTFHIVSIGEEFGFEKERVMDLFIPMAVISVAVNLLFGWLNSRIRLKYMLLLMNIGALLATLGLYQWNAPWGVAAYLLGNGITGGVFASLVGVVWPRFFGRRWIGSIAGLAMSSMVVASGIGPWLFALSQQFTGSYQWILGISILVPAALCGASFFADNPQSREKPAETGQ